jgi:hypothetical protein
MPISTRWDGTIILTWFCDWESSVVLTQSLIQIRAVCDDNYGFVLPDSIAKSPLEWSGCHLFFHHSGIARNSKMGRITWLGTMCKVVRDRTLWCRFLAENGYQRQPLFPIRAYLVLAYQRLIWLISGDGSLRLNCLTRSKKILPGEKKPRWRRVLAENSTSLKSWYSGALVFMVDYLPAFGENYTWVRRTGLVDLLALSCRWHLARSTLLQQER